MHFLRPTSYPFVSLFTEAIVVQASLGQFVTRSFLSNLHSVSPFSAVLPCVWLAAEKCKRVIKLWNMKLELGEEQDFRGHRVLFYPECYGKQLKSFKKGSDSFQLLVLKYDYCVENRLEWGARIHMGRAIKKPFQKKKSYCSNLKHLLCCKNKNDIFLAFLEI